MKIYRRNGLGLGIVFICSILIAGCENQAGGTAGRGDFFKSAGADLRGLPGRRIYLPIAHGEGKIVTKDHPTLEKLRADGLVAFKYVDENGNEGGYPINPSSSTDSIAGLTDSTGRVLGLMPHPERHVRFTQHPRWPRCAS